MPQRNFPRPYIVVDVFLVLYLLPSIAAIEKLQPYIPTDLILLNCGSSSSATSPDGRNWDGDANSKFNASVQKTSSALQTNPYIFHVPYTTARVFHSNYTYSFPVLPGPKFVRLYFSPTNYTNNLDTSKSFFSLNANTYNLLNNFSASLTLSSMNTEDAYFTKEFVVTVWDNRKLELSFSPSPGSFAFINGIEIVSMPNSLYFSGNDTPLTYVGFNYPFYLDNNTALETAFRLNVGGGLIGNTDDTGMFRRWFDDTDYIFGAAFGMVKAPREVEIKYTVVRAYIAPPLVYQTFRSMGNDPKLTLNYNLTWSFQVDVGFNFLVRLHFCLTIVELMKQNDLVFFIYINNQTAEEQADIIYWSGGQNVPVYRDYVVWIPEGSNIKQELWIALHPNLNSKPASAGAILNGLEIFKLNKADGSLAAPNPEPVVILSPPVQHGKDLKKREAGLIVVIKIITGAVTSFLAFLLAFFLIIRPRLKAKDLGTRGTVRWHPFASARLHSSAMPTELCHQFSLAEIQAATNNFDKAWIIGVGGFGEVYKGFINDRATTVAIKRLNPQSQQGAIEFKTEINMLSQFRHINLVSLIGYCSEDQEMILMYEYMANGTLCDYLYNTNNPPLSWKQRLEICIGAAHGLHYLHSGLKQIIIHRDVKTTNILLDEKWVAKVSDFGLSKLGPTSASQTHVSTLVKGSFGYLDPEYYRRQQLTEKSDVYSFGVVLLEVLCGKPPTSRLVVDRPTNLAEWAKQCYRNETLGNIIDPHIKGEIAAECLKKFSELAMSCLLEIGTKRPSMNDVVWGLEFALQLQETAVRNSNGGDDIGVNMDQEIPLIPCQGEESVDSGSCDTSLAVHVGDIGVFVI